MVKIERTPTAPPSLAIEKAKANGSYNGQDVMEQLELDSHGKCYLCEIDELQSVEVEHLKAHHNGKDKDREFDWNNLFYSCRHCNGVKNQKKYEEQILDCCATDPETVMNQLFRKGHVVVEPLDESESVKLTAELLTECFEKTNTGSRIIACKTRINALQKIMDQLYNALRKYRKNPTKRVKMELLGLLERSHKFAGFTRTYVRLYEENGAELLSCADKKSA